MNNITTQADLWHGNIMSAATQAGTAHSLDVKMRDGAAAQGRRQTLSNRQGAQSGMLAGTFAARLAITPELAVTA